MHNPRFEWDSHKSRANRRKHGISFVEAQSVFFDGNALLIPDPDHSRDEERFIMIGSSFALKMLVVCHCYRQAGSVIRIISARKASRSERFEYEARLP